MSNSKRLQKELTQLHSDKIANVASITPSESDIFQWIVILKGPNGTPYAGGQFHISFTFPENYPFKPPHIKFTTKIYHPSIQLATGDICSDVISEDWGPTLSVRHCINVILNTLENPNADSPLEEEIAAKLREKPKEFEKIAKKWTKDHAMN